MINPAAIKDQIDLEIVMKAAPEYELIGKPIL